MTNEILRIDGTTERHHHRAFHRNTFLQIDQVLHPECVDIF